MKVDLARDWRHVMRLPNSRRYRTLVEQRLSFKVADIVLGAGIEGGALRKSTADGQDWQGWPASGLGATLVVHDDNNDFYAQFAKPHLLHPFALFHERPPWHNFR